MVGTDVQQSQAGVQRRRRREGVRKDGPSAAEGELSAGRRGRRSAVVVDDAGVVRGLRRFSTRSRTRSVSATVRSGGILQSDGRPGRYRTTIILAYRRGGEEEEEETPRRFVEFVLAQPPGLRPLPPSRPVGLFRRREGGGQKGRVDLLGHAPRIVPLPSVPLPPVQGEGGGVPAGGGSVPEERIGRLQGSASPGFLREGDTAFPRQSRDGGVVRSEESRPASPGELRLDVVRRR
mmetsp:Transcript_18498/g.53347  ORF Transcript_18498/g.53347 Transcript_18498/m.53347 type:complete len:235 (+) Transcript_18498:252-956(+)